MDYPDWEGMIANSERWVENIGVETDEEAPAIRSRGGRQSGRGAAGNPVAGRRRVLTNCVAAIAGI
jgi:hypothetical protein